MQKPPRETIHASEKREAPIHSTPIDERDEEELCRRFRLGDPDATEALFARYRQKVWIVCRRILGNPSDAEDLAQETFLRATRTDSFNGSAFGGWIYRIAVNLCRNHLDSRVKRKSREESFAEGQSSAPSPAQVYREKFAEKEMSEALDELSSELREVLVMKYLEELTAPDVAEILDLPLTTVEGRLRQGRAKLRTILLRRKTV